MRQATSAAGQSRQLLLTQLSLPLPLLFGLWTSAGSSPDPGGYDHSVRLWDTRTEKCVVQVDHGAPVESVLMFPQGNQFISAGVTTEPISRAPLEGHPSIPAWRQCLLPHVRVHQPTLAADTDPLVFRVGVRRWQSDQGVGRSWAHSSGVFFLKSPEGDHM